MTITEYSYTEADIYRAIVQTAVPMALTADEETLLVNDLLLLGTEDMPHDEPAAVFYELGRRIGNAWRSYVDALSAGARRTAVLARQAADYPSLKGGV